MGIARIIDHPNHGEVLTAIREVLESTRNSGRSSPNGLCHRIWRLLQALLAIPGVRPHRYGVSVTLNHRFVDPLATGPGSGAGTHPDLVVEAFYTHLRSAGGGMLAVGSAVHAGDLVGALGTTGNAISGHLHLELTATRGGIAVGTLMPHEFYPLMRDYLAWLATVERAARR